MARYVVRVLREHDHTYLEREVEANSFDLAAHRALDELRGIYPADGGFYLAIVESVRRVSP